MGQPRGQRPERRQALRTPGDLLQGGPLLLRPLAIRDVDPEGQHARESPVGDERAVAPRDRALLTGGGEEWGLEVDGPVRHLDGAEDDRPRAP